MHFPWKPTHFRRGDLNNYYFSIQPLFNPFHPKFIYKLSLQKQVVHKLLICNEIETEKMKSMYHFTFFINKLRNQHVSLFYIRHFLTFAHHLLVTEIYI